MSIFKDSFTPTVRKQLEVRGNAFLKRTPSDIIYINGRAAWVRMVSGVDIGGDSTAAKNNILQGGVLSYTNSIDPKTKKPIDIYNLRAGVGNTFNNNAYSNITSGLGNQANLYGLRPMPGITGVDISSKSAYGSVRIANVTFNCWDIKQLELFELLYMRPGFLLLLEWGWLPYLDNKGNIQTNIQPYDIFSDRPKNISLQDRLREVYQNSKKHDANYEGILGYIKNYDWSIRPDGGYDCRTEIISTGEILESLKINYATNFLTSVELQRGLLFPGIDPSTQRSYLPDDRRDELQSLYETNIIAGIVGELIYYAYNHVSTNTEGYSWFYFDKNQSGKVTGNPNGSISFFQIDINSGAQQEDTKNSLVDPNKQIYIDLESFIKVLNKWAIPADQNSKISIVPLTLKHRTYDTENPEKDLLCLAHPLQISVDPRVCLIRNDNFKSVSKLSIVTNAPASILPIESDPNKRKLLAAAKATIPALLNKLNELNNDPNIGINDKTDAVGLYLELYLLKAKEYGLLNNFSTDLDLVAKYLANAWEDYKYKRIDTTVIEKITTTGNTNNSFTGTGTSSVITSIKYKYQILAPYSDTPLIVPEDGEFEDKNKAIDFISGYSFLYAIDYLISSQLPGGHQLNPDGTPFVKGTPIIQNAFGVGDDWVKFKAESAVSTPAKTAIIDKIKLNDPSLNEADFESLSFLNKLQKQYFVSTPNGTFGSIGNIYVNLNNILSLSLDGSLEANDLKGKNDINLYDFLKKIMSQIQSSIGNLNNFEIHTDPTDGIARIIDINYVDERTTEDVYNTAFTFLSKQPTGIGVGLDGLFNNVRSYKISSRIFKEQSSIVAISAQNGGGTMGLDNETLVGWNRGITNRLMSNTAPPTLPSNSQANSRTIALIDAVKSLTKYAKDLGWIATDDAGSETKDRVYSVDASGKYKGALKDLIDNFKALTKTDASFRSIIPTVVSLELDGIGGLVIGHLFRLPPELLPLGYKGEIIPGKGEVGRKLGYIVTKIGHKISNSDWVTNIDAQTVILEESDNPSFDLEEVLKLAEAGADVEINASTGTVSVNNNQINKGTPISISKKPLVEQIISYAKSKGITDPQRLTAILTVAQAESGLSPEKSEDLKYSVSRAKAVFPGKLKGKTDAEIAKIFANETSAGEFLYGGRFGNSKPGDGFAYRGRGLTQITFKSNYIAMQNNLKKAGENIDIVANPELVNKTENSVKILVVGKLYKQFGAALKQEVNYKNNPYEIILTQNGNDKTPNAETLQVYTRALASVNSTNWIQDLLK